jgi:uncharacterized protein with HEPN domain
MNRQTFVANETTIFAVQYALLAISEAAVRLGEQAAQRSPDIL